MAETSTDEQKGRILPYSEFNLNSFKLLKDGDDGVKINYYIKGADSMGGEMSPEWKPHPDLFEKLSELKLYMATNLGLIEGWDFAREHLKRNPNYLQKAIQGHKDVVSRMSVSGLVFQGSGETEGVKITGSIKTPTGGSVGLAVPKISFNSEELGYETEVEEICEEIKKEIYNYFFLKKKEQANIEDQAEGFDNEGGFLQIDLEDAIEEARTKDESEEE